MLIPLTVALGLGAIREANVSVRQTNRGVVQKLLATNHPSGMPLASLMAPLATLAVLWVAGLGVASLIARRAPQDAQAALAPLATSAIVFITSPVVLAGLSPIAAMAITLGGLSLITVVRGRHSIALARRGALPALSACLAIGLTATPALKHQTWAAATSGNQDPYVWVSQARSIENSPATGALGTSPDRVVYELLQHRHWPTAIPVSLAQLASTEGVDPVDAYGVFAVVIAGLLALAVFFGARGCMRWSRKRAAIAAAVVTANGLVLLSSFYGWQAQLLLTIAGTLFVLTLPQCFTRRSRTSDCAAPALFLASGVALYGWIVAPFVLIGVAVAVVCLRQTARHSPRLWRAGVRQAATIAGMAFALGSVAVARAAATLAEGAQNASPAELASWNRYAWAYPSEALGLVPRSPRDYPAVAWEVLAIVAAATLLARGIRSAWSFRNPRGVVLVTAGATIVAELLLIAISGSSPYPSLKLMAYSAPLLALLALSPRVHAPGTAKRPSIGRRSRAFGLAFADVIAVCLFAATTAVSLFIGLDATHPATAVAATANAAQSLPPRDVIRIAVDDPRDQVWLVYLLRDRPLALEKPSIVFTGYSEHEATRAQRYDAMADFEIRNSVGGQPLWSDGKLAIYRLSGGNADLDDGALRR